MHFCRQSRLSILATPTTTHHHQHQLNRLELGVSFSSGLPGWFRSCFFVSFIKDFSCTAQICLGFSPGGWGSGCHLRPAVGTRLSYVQESGFVRCSTAQHRAQHTPQRTPQTPCPHKHTNKRTGLLTASSGPASVCHVLEYGTGKY